MQSFQSQVLRPSAVVKAVHTSAILPGMTTSILSAFSGELSFVTLTGAASGWASAAAQQAGAAAGGRGSAPMHGKVLEVLVAPGDAVRKGDRLAVIEAMKMEHTLLAPIDGIVADVRVTVPAQVAQGAHLMTIEPE